MEIKFYNSLLIFIFIISIFVLLILFFVNAPYGRFTRKGWGIRINPKAAWFIMELPAFVLPIIFFLFGNKKTSLVAFIFLIIWSAHYFQRTFIFSLLLKSRKNSFPILIMLFSIIFNLINGYLNGRYLFYFSPVYDISWLYDIRFIAGFLIFVLGFVINILSDKILRGLRKAISREITNAGSVNGLEGSMVFSMANSIGMCNKFILRNNNNNDANKNFLYKIPNGALFKYISSPNYLGEVLEWIGWAILTWSLAGLAFAVFTIANLLPRAYATHKWYIKNFPDYPKERKAIIPFIF